jgi:hypothetical protein
MISQYDIIKELYDAGRLTAAKGVKNAVVKGLITAAEYKEITGAEYSAAAAATTTATTTTATTTA